MTLEERRPLRNRHLQRVGVVGRLVRGPAHREAGIPLPEQADLMQLEVLGRCGVDRYAVHDRGVERPVLTERHDIVDFVEREAAGREHHRLAGGRDPFQERPVRGGARGDLDEIEVETLDQVQRGFVERRGHRAEARVAHGRRQANPVVDAEARRQEPLDVLRLVGGAIRGVDEGVQLSKLELHGRLDFRRPHDLGACGDDVQRVAHAALVVVREIEDEQVAASQPRRIVAVVPHQSDDSTPRAAGSWP